MNNNNNQFSPFHDNHLACKAQMVSFNGFWLPINYGSQIAEHQVVRNDAGMFDVSHMLITDVYGSGARDYLRYIFSNDVAKLDNHQGKALYGALLNADAGVIDDLIVYSLSFGYRLVSNGATREKVRQWLNDTSKNFTVTLKEPNDLAMLAVQGPQAINKLSHIAMLTGAQDALQQLKPFYAFNHNECFIARTGYTGEDGVEIILNRQLANVLWQQLLSVGVKPCGLGARDTLRLEAGMNLYGHEMNEDITPLSCGMKNVVDITDQSRSFVGKDCYLRLSMQKEHTLPERIGLILKHGGGVLRQGQEVFINDVVSGVITSGSFSPSLNKSIAIARVSMPMESVDNTITVNIRGIYHEVNKVPLPFVRRIKNSGPAPTKNTHA